LLLVSDVPGTVFSNRIMGRSMIERDDRSALVEVGAGENWHELVLWSLEQGLSGLDNLSLIPGLAGAAPIQNIGAYGVELSSVLVSVTAWDWSKQTWRVFSREDCRFGYRDSRFKSSEPDRYLITSLRLSLDTEFQPRLSYPGLAEALEETAPGAPNARQVSDAVVRIRRRKLPDPARTGNAGSFFKNPVVERSLADDLRADHPDLPAWPVGDIAVKLSAAWMIERCGLKGRREGAAGVSPLHALVLVNHGGASGADIWDLACKVRSVVEQAFGIVLEPEPRIFNFDN
ncbi:MAG: UDP-N-acetylmuramate dehydrogenase, partial [Xanthomonadales bacterium]|nr:UDP-N-acetylmuramate dehydrogenase [Xanthomonadales bacterium]